MSHEIGSLVPIVLFPSLFVVVGVGKDVTDKDFLAIKD
jgi:hypothetical protein